MIPKFAENSGDLGFRWSDDCVVGWATTLQGWL